MSVEAKTITQDDGPDMVDNVKKRTITLSSQPSALLSKEGFALYVGKTPAAIVAMAKAGKLPRFTWLTR